MKSFIKSLRLINAGFLLGIAFTCWVLGENENKEEKKDVDWAGDKASTLDDIYNHYKQKEKQNA
ncbi:MAG: hypothetical protein ACK5S6_01775 [bacterium]|jgi:hypothetical protein